MLDAQIYAALTSFGRHLGITAPWRGKGARLSEQQRRDGGGSLCDFGECACMHQFAHLLAQKLTGGSVFGTFWRELQVAEIETEK